VTDLTDATRVLTDSAKVIVNGLESQPEICQFAIRKYKEMKSQVYHGADFEIQEQIEA